MWSSVAEDTLQIMDAKECWILKTGDEIVKLVAEYDKVVPDPARRRMQTLDFANMYGTILSSDLKRVMQLMLTSVFERRSDGKGQ